MKIRKKLAIMLTIALLCTSFVACTSGELLIKVGMKSQKVLCLD
ncbi:hypothetical protein [Clostridium ljungdahlii]